MKANDAISKILIDRDKSKRSLADDLGISPQRWTSGSRHAR